MEGASTIVLDRGFDGAGMGEIARCAGVSKNMFKRNVSRFA